MRLSMMIQNIRVISVIMLLLSDVNYKDTLGKNFSDFLFIFFKLRNDANKGTY